MSDDEDAAAGESDRTEGAVGGSDVRVGVDEQRELEPVLAREYPLVAVDRLGRYPDDLDVGLVEAVEIVVVLVDLLGAHGRGVARREHDHERPAQELGQRERAVAGASEREVGRLVTNVDVRPAAFSTMSSPAMVTASKLDATFTFGPPSCSATSAMNE